MDYIKSLHVKAFIYVFYTCNKLLPHIRKIKYSIKQINFLYHQQHPV